MLMAVILFVDIVELPYLSENDEPERLLFGEVASPTHPAPQPPGWMR
jgi:hypothetical protein